MSVVQADSKLLLNILSLQKLEIKVIISYLIGVIGLIRKKLKVISKD